MNNNYSFDDFESDSAEWFSKNKEEPFIYKINDILYPNPEFLSESMPEDMDSKKTHMCIFCIDYNCVLPFVKYVLFPNETDETVDLIGMQDLELLFDYMNAEQTILIETAYRGFTDRGDDIYMFFDITSLLKSGAQLKSGFVYSVAHELCTLQHIQGNMIGKNVKNMLDKDDDTFPKCAILQPWFYNADGILEMIEVPQVMYICGTDLQNLTLDELNRGTGTFLTTDCLVDYEDVGLHYYFTESVKRTDASYIRCMVFLMQVKEVNLRKKQKNVDSTEYNSVSFVLDGEQYWGVKSIDQFVPI
jgi:hypothetical protein